MYRYFKTSSNTYYISSWKSKGLYDEVIKPPTISKCFTPSLNYMGIKYLIFNEKEWHYIKFLNLFKKCLL